MKKKDLKEIEEYLKKCLQELDGIQEYDDEAKNVAYKLRFLRANIKLLIKKIRRDSFELNKDGNIEIKDKENRVEVKISLVGAQEFIEQLETIKRLLNDIKNTKIEIL